MSNTILKDAKTLLGKHFPTSSLLRNPPQGGAWYLSSFFEHYREEHGPQPANALQLKAIARVQDTAVRSGVDLASRLYEACIATWWGQIAEHIANLADGAATTGEATTARVWLTSLQDHATLFEASLSDAPCSHLVKTARTTRTIGIQPATGESYECTGQITWYLDKSSCYFHTWTEGGYHFGKFIGACQVTLYRPQDLVYYAPPTLPAPPKRTGGGFEFL